MWIPSLLAVRMMQFWTYFWRLCQCRLNFMPFASSLHAAVAFSRATLSALDIFAASAGVGTNAMLLTASSTCATTMGTADDACFADATVACLAAPLRYGAARP